MLFLSLLCYCHSYAQKNGIEKLSESKVDSLKAEHVDNILWYHSYCGDCFYAKTDSLIQYGRCLVENGYSLSYNVIIYQQKGKYFTLNFDCKSIVIKRQLDTCRSLLYFVSIIPTLNARDKTLRSKLKKGELPDPMPLDGGSFAEAHIYYHNAKQHVRLPETTDTSNKKYFWMNKEIKLVEL